MRYIYLLIVLIFLLAFSCKKENIEIENTLQNNFEVLWNDFDLNYPVFQLNNINWDSVYNVNYAKLNSNTTDNTFFNILKSSILALKDAHSDIISNQFGSCHYYDLFVQQKPSNFISWNTIFTNYVQLIKVNHSNATMGYGKVIDHDIGYFLIESFYENENDYYLIDSFLDEFQNSKGLIIDIRQNGGGNEMYGQIVASRLTEQAVTYRYARYRNGPNHSDLSDYLPLILRPDGKLKYTKTVVLLTNRHTFSAAEDFTLMLKALSNVIHIGDSTFGGVATNPINKTLSNGWTYKLASAINYDNNRVPIKGGIAPDYSVTISKSDSINGIDRIIEEAIKKIEEN